MAKRKFHLTPEEIEEISNTLAVAQPNPGYHRLEAILAYHLGEKWASLTKRFHCSRSTLYQWCKTYRQHGRDVLVIRAHGRSVARLTSSQLADLAAKVRAHRPRDIFHDSAASNNDHWTAKDLFRAIKLWYGVVYKSPATYYGLLSRLDCGEPRS